MQPGDGVVWITGASAGLGRALALRFAQAGFRVTAFLHRREYFVVFHRADKSDRCVIRAAQAELLESEKGCLSHGGVRVVQLRLHLIRVRLCIGPGYGSE